MKEFIKFPSIEQFRTVIKEVRSRAQFVGLDAEEKPIFDRTKSLPIIKYRGTAKIHGTNASVCYDGTEYWAQSRNNILTLEKDNCGFAYFAEKNKEFFIDYINAIVDNIQLQHDYNNDSYALDNKFTRPTIAVFGEFAGNGIQSGVALSALDKKFIIFGVWIVFDEHAFWFSDDTSKDLLEYIIDKNQNYIFHILQFETWDLEIDFENPTLIQNELIRITKEVEAECPVGKYFGIVGIGEGIVLKPTDESWNNSRFFFKSKGEKHSATKVKKLNSVDVEKVNSVNEFAENVCTEARLKQGLDYLREQNLDADIKNTGAYLKWVTSDVFKEETDVLIASGLEPKDVGKKISDISRRWFMQQLG